VSDHLVLLAPASNRVYAGSADLLAAAELSIMIGRAAHDLVNIEPIQLAGVGYLRLDVSRLDVPLEQVIGRLSALFAVFRRENDQLVPVPIQRPELFDDDLVSIPKYPGKTNEQFTRLLMNVTLASVNRDTTGTWSILDPMCGRGTTLSTGLILGHDVAGVDADLKAIEAYAAYLRTYLRRKRLKHTVELNPVRREGKSVGRRLDVEVTPAETDRRLKLSAISGDTRQSAALFGKRRFDAVVTDAPYGIVHGSQTDVRGVSGKRDRSPAGLIGEALNVWAGQLKSGGALGLSWNTFGLTREKLNGLAVAAGLSPLVEPSYLRFGHRVDSSIHRDIFVAVKS
jgi:hypothetical protein